MKKLLQELLEAIDYKIVVLFLLSALLFIVAAAISGCHNAVPPLITGGGQPPAEPIVKTIVSINALPYLGVLAMSGAVFIAFMGNTKIGLAVGAAGATALATSMAVIQYAWILGLLSMLALIIGGGIAVIGNMRFKKQLVQGIQNVKSVIEGGSAIVHRDQVNQAVAAVQTSDVTAQVSKIKVKLEAENAAHTG